MSLETTTTWSPRETAALTAAIADDAGLLRLDAALVARDWIPPGRRLGLPDDAYEVGDRGFICERWLGSTTHADNRIGPPDEGVSRIRTRSGERLDLGAAVTAAPAAIMGAAYAADHDGLGRLAKIYDFAARIPMHIHPPAEQAALVGRNSKDESSWYPPDVPMGPHPESFFGLHPEIAETRDGEPILRHLRAWRDDAILENSPAYQQRPGEGYFVTSGVLHAPGTALTVELQEDADTMAFFQAWNAGRPISKDMLFKDVSDRDRAALGESALLRWIDWEANGDRYFHRRRRILPLPIREDGGATESWILYGSRKFSGKLLELAPGAAIGNVEAGVHNLLVWSGTGAVGGHEVVGFTPDQDEILVTAEAAERGYEIRNTGATPMIVVKFFGPDINTDAPIVDLG
jgi:hypothetical protein